MNNMSETTQATSNISSEEKAALQMAAYQKGYNDYKSRMSGKSSSSITQPSPSPPAGFEDYYNEGWQNASQQAISDAETKSRHGEGMGYIQLGAVLLVVGLVMAGIAFYYKSYRLGPLPLLLMGGGLMSLVTGIYKYFSRIEEKKDIEMEVIEFHNKEVQEQIRKSDSKHLNWRAILVSFLLVLFVFIMLWLRNK